MQDKEEKKKEIERQKIEKQNERKRKAEQRAKGKENIPKRRRNAQKPKAAPKGTLIKKKKPQVQEESEDSDIDSPNASQENDTEPEEFCGTCGKSFQKDFNGEGVDQMLQMQHMESYEMSEIEK